MGRSSGSLGRDRPVLAESGREFQFTSGSGGEPLDSPVVGILVLKPWYSGTYFYPNGYVSYFNVGGPDGQYPFTGQTIAHSDLFWQ